MSYPISKPKQELLAKVAALDAGAPGKWSRHDLLIQALVEEGAYFDGVYLVYSVGRKKGYITNGGYCVVMVTFGKDRYSYISRGRFTCWRHHGAPTPERPFVDHINRNRLDDAPTNLRWVTPSENAKNVSPEDVKRRVAAQQAALIGQVGSKVGCAKLTEAAVAAIRDKYSTGRYSMKALGAEYGVSHRTIYPILHNHTWRHVPAVAMKGPRVWIRRPDLAARRPSPELALAGTPAQ